MKELKLFRKINGLTQDELGEYLDMKKSFVSKVENGREKIPVNKLQKLLNNDRGWDVCALVDVATDDTVKSESLPRTSLELEVVRLRAENEILKAQLAWSTKIIEKNFKNE